MASMQPCQAIAQAKEEKKCGEMLPLFRGNRLAFCTAFPSVRRILCLRFSYPNKLNLAPCCAQSRNISCSPGTLARDLQELASWGICPQKIFPYDFFPQTPHVETLVWLGVDQGA